MIYNRSSVLEWGTGESGEQVIVPRVPVGPTEGDRAGSVEALVTHMAEFERAETGARPSHSFEANARRRPSNQRQQRDQATWRRIIGETTTIPICSGRRSFPGWPQCRCPGYGGDGHVSLDGIEGPGRPPIPHPRHWKALGDLAEQQPRYASVNTKRTTT